MKNKFISLILIILSTFLISVTVFADNIPTQTSNFYVNDFANIIDLDTEEHIMEKQMKLLRPARQGKKQKTY